MPQKSSIDKIVEIYKKSGLSISKFAKIINKDRRTATSWIDKNNKKEPSSDVKEQICKFFRYSYEIWNENCQDEEFFKLINDIPTQEIRIVDEGYLGGLKYILEQEDKERLVIQAQFPGPIYRDAIVSKVYRGARSTEAEAFKKERTQKMLAHSFCSTEWYSIKSLLGFCFSPIGNFYTTEQKIQILELIINTFKNNYNKFLYFYDSYSRKIYGLDTAYTSINIKEGVMFFKSPLESVLVEIRNKKLVEQIHHHFTDATEAPSHINPSNACEILQILKNSIDSKDGLCEAYEKINTKTNYGGLFFNSISLNLQKNLSAPAPNQKRN